MAAKNAWSETSIIRELNQLSASKTSTPLVSSVKRRNPKRNNSNSSNLGICSPMVLRKIKPKSPTLVEIPEEQETITLDDSDEDQNKTIVLKEKIKRDSIQIIHEDPVSTIPPGPSYISLVPSNPKSSESVEILEIPNMRPDRQPKRKRSLQKLNPQKIRSTAGSPGPGHSKVKKTVKRITIQKSKDRRIQTRRNKAGRAAPGQTPNKMKKKVELKNKPPTQQVTNMFNPKMKADIRFSSIENNQMGLPFQFGRPQPLRLREPSQQRNCPQPIKRLRPIVIDGQNIAVEHAKRTENPFGFSSRGIQIAVDYFKAKGCTQIEVWLPRDRHQVGRCDNQMILNKLLEQNILQFSPSRRVRGHYENAYDDRYVVQNAAAKEGIIVSNDHFRDLIGEDETFKEAIENRLLQFNFVTDKDGIYDTFMVPRDPKGKHGPRLEEFLMF